MDIATLTQQLGSYLTDQRLERIEQVLAQRTRYLAVALEDIFQGQNAAAVLRSCECYGVQDIHCIELRNHFAPSDEVAMGSQKWLSIYRYNDTAQALALLKQQGYQIVATCLDETSTPLAEIPLDRPTLLLFGTELTGLSSQALANCDRRAYLPMVGFTQSFNISVSVALSLQILFKRLHNECPWQLTDPQKDLLRLEWIRKSLPHADAIEKQIIKHASENN